MHQLLVDYALFLDSTVRVEFCDPNIADIRTVPQDRRRMDSQLRCSVNPYVRGDLPEAWGCAPATAHTQGESRGAPLLVLLGIDPGERGRSEVPCKGIPLESPESRRAAVGGAV